jgi:hypothetical protein
MILLFAASAAAVFAADQTIETIHATVMRLEGAGPNTGQLIVNLDRYTTDEELAKDVEAFRAGGQEAMVDRWWKEKPVVGRARFAQTLGIDLRVARSRPTENGGRRIIIVTDRPIAGFEVMRGTRSEDYPIGWIEAEVDANGVGEGRMIGAAELKVEDGQLVIESFGTQPARLTRVKVTKKD